jgi:hypothetical protein
MVPQRPRRGLVISSANVVWIAGGRRVTNKDDSSRRAGTLEINLLGTYMIVVASALAYALAALWPIVHGTDKKEWVQKVLFLGREYPMANETRLTLIVMVTGALGSFVHAATSFGTYVGNQRLYSTWTWWYVLRPFIGMGLALVFYFVIFGGMLSAGAGADAVNPFGIAAVAGMVGMFAKQATDKLNETFSTLFKTNPERGDGEREDKLSNKVAILKSISPHRIEVDSPARRISLRGRHFVEGVVVRVNASDRETTFESDTLVSVDLRKDDLRCEGELELTVFSPPPGGGASNAVTLTVTPKGQHPDVSVSPTVGDRSLEA